MDDFKDFKGIDDFFNVNNSENMENTNTTTETQQSEAPVIIPVVSESELVKDKPITYSYIAPPPEAIPAAPEPPKPKKIKKEKGEKKKRPILSFAVMAVAVAMIGSSSGYLAVYFAKDSLLPNYDENISKGVVQISDSSTVPLNDKNTITNENFLINDRLAEMNTTNEFTYKQLYDVVKGSVVAIKGYYNTRTWNGVTEESGVVGSGVVFTTDGYVITNNHVIEGANKIAVIVNDYDDDTITYEYEAEVIGFDSPADIAVLKISRPEEFQISPIGESAGLSIGQEVAAVGYPLGIGKTMTTGIVSSFESGSNTTGYELNSVQIDAAVNPGNSGGPLFDLYGNVVGIVNKKLVYDSIENMGFAITIDEAKPIINDILQNGKVTSRAVLGITATQIDASYGFGVDHGLIINSINQSAPVAKSDLSRGDIIVKINGNDVSSVADIQTNTKYSKPGDEVTVTVARFDELGNIVEVDIIVELTSQTVS